MLICAGHSGRKVVIMDKIIKKISEIEAAASSVMEQANRQKKFLAVEMEARTRAFDEELNARTEAEIREFQKELEADMQNRLADQKAAAARTLRQMEDNYEAHHQKYVLDLFQALIRE